MTVQERALSVARLTIEYVVICGTDQLIQQIKIKWKIKPSEKSDSCFSFSSLALIQDLQDKVAVHGVRLVVPGLESATVATASSPMQKGLQHILAEICDLELNGNLHSELEQIVTREKMHFLDDPLLNGLLDSTELRTCIDVALENMTSRRMKIIEVSWKPGMGP